MKRKIFSVVVIAAMMLVSTVEFTGCGQATDSTSTVTEVYSSRQLETSAENNTSDTMETSESVENETSDKSDLTEGSGKEGTDGQETDNRKTTTNGQKTEPVTKAPEEQKTESETKAWEQPSTESETKAWEQPSTETETKVQEQPSTEQEANSPVEPETPAEISNPVVDPGYFVNYAISYASALGMNIVSGQGGSWDNPISISGSGLRNSGEGYFLGRIRSRIDMYYSQDYTYLDIYYVSSGENACDIYICYS